MRWSAAGIGAAAARERPEEPLMWDGPPKRSAGG